MCPRSPTLAFGGLWGLRPRSWPSLGPSCFMLWGKEEEALEALAWLRGRDTDFHREFQQIQNSVQQQSSRLSWAELRDPFIYKPIAIAVLMRFLQQLTGVTPILVYLQSIFHSTAVLLPAEEDAAIVGAVRLVSVLIAATTMDKAGRKILLFVSASMMLVANLVLGLYVQLSPQPPAPNATVDLSGGALEASGSGSYLMLVPLLATMLFIMGARLQTSARGGEGGRGYVAGYPCGPAPQSNCDSVVSVLFWESLWPWVRLWMFVGYVYSRLVCARTSVGAAGTDGEGALWPAIVKSMEPEGYAMGWGPITWLLMSEILPLKARGVASGLCVLVSWLTAFVLTKSFLLVVNAFGLQVPFYFFAAICLVNLVFTGCCVPETRRRSLEQIESFFRTGRKSFLR